jgi:transaldolase
MKLYIDSADIFAIESLMKTGVFYGVTTNPLLLRNSGVSPDRLGGFVDQVTSLGAREVYLQSWGDDSMVLRSNAQKLARISENVVIKLPVTREGLEAASGLAGEGIRICITAVYAPFQALLGASVGAAYVAPYLGRMNDAGLDGHAMIAQMSEALRNTDSATEILAASVRTPEDMAMLGRNGIGRITLSSAVADMLFCEPLSIEAAKAFEVAAGEIAKKGDLS